MQHCEDVRCEHSPKKNAAFNVLTPTVRHETDYFHDFKKIEVVNFAAQP